ncbi:hypothetical protein BJ170DRAFT_12832 [Xylariales sp. AK1849]|nr:hypothetical protein BJ170DRAFT_12832 [Xylariales sp. AK1849]
MLWRRICAILVSSSDCLYNSRTTQAGSVTGNKPKVTCTSVFTALNAFKQRPGRRLSHAPSIVLSRQASRIRVHPCVGFPVKNFPWIEPVHPSLV